MKIVKLDRLAGPVAAILLLCLAAQLFAADELDVLLADAFMKGDSATAKSLINRGANVNARFSGVPFLMFAVTRGQTTCARLLIDAGADMNAQANGVTALMLATQNGHTETANSLRRAGTK